MKIYVSNVSSYVNETDLEETYSAFGEVESVRIFPDGPATKSKRLALVELKDKEKESLTRLQRLLRQINRVSRRIYFRILSKMREVTASST